MQKNRVILSILLQQILIQYAQAQCPADFTEVSPGVCMIMTTRSSTFCGSHSYCEQEGIRRSLRLTVPGKNYLGMKNILSSPSYVYTGLSNVLNRTTNLQQGWRYNDPGWALFETPPSDTNIQWAISHPINLTTSFAAFLDLQLMSVLQLTRKSTHVVCEISSKAVNQSVELFKRDWPYPISTMFLNDLNNLACFNSFNVTFLSECARKCKRQTVCRSFYFLKETGQCWISLYVDSLLPSSLAALNGTWYIWDLPAYSAYVNTRQSVASTMQNNVAFFVLCELMLVQLTQGQCPTGFTETDPGVCMYLAVQSNSFCGSNSFCEQFGLSRGLRLFLPGKNYKSMLKILPATSSAFTGLTSLLNRSSDYRQGWRFSDPGTAWYETPPGDTSIQWTLGEPSQRDQLVSIYYNGSFFAAPQFSIQASHIVCEVSPVQSVALAETFQLDWPYRMSSVFLAEGGNVGCQLSTNTSTLEECCHQCKRQPACRAFYYHVETGNCWFVYFVDTLLPSSESGTSGTWLRYGRPYW
ncbi:hypothetical protein FGIG_10377 [Fasciola gigantica]|uniref:Apple domain-containing protein n=1 Tax=Fasciola gigantica TaxID=46835 RepID=A0A504YLK4_FASGI|nr:hypothetical protein FGIG_10377 [Fasciola gigantica]